MKRDDLIKKCRYYHGETHSPYNENNIDNSTLWYYELCWVDFLSQNPDRLNFEVSEYKHNGLTDFNAYDGTPLSLKALIFNRFIHRDAERTIIDPVEEFKNFYLTQYLKIKG